jgi:regulator of PEP synthase PpsR (kinase-PPPase family)
MSRKFHLHLVSDSTGETVKIVARAALAQFEDTQAIEHVWSLIRAPAQLDRVVAAVKANPGVVLFTLVDRTLRESLIEACRPLQVPCIPVLERVILGLGNYLGQESRDKPGRQHIMDAEYFARIDAMHYVLGHDDGQATRGLANADVVLVGVSRTSKTPTCFYLANRGIKAANVPIVPGVPLPEELSQLKGPLVVGLTKSPDRLVQVRRNRLKMLSEDTETDYIDLERVKEEVAAARRLFTAKGWPVIDVSRRSIEETAASIMQLLDEQRRAAE